MSGGRRHLGSGLSLLLVAGVTLAAPDEDGDGDAPEPPPTPAQAMRLLGWDRPADAAVGLADRPAAELAAVALDLLAGTKDPRSLLGAGTWLAGWTADSREPPAVGARADAIARIDSRLRIPADAPPLPPVLQHALLEVRTCLAGAEGAHDLRRALEETAALEDVPILVRGAARSPRRGALRPVFQALEATVEAEAGERTAAIEEGLRQVAQTPRAIQLIEAFRWGDAPIERAAVLDRVRDRAAREALQPLIEELLELDEAARTIGVGLLHLPGTPEARDAVRLHLSDASPQVRAAACRATWRLVLSDTIPSLAFLLDDPDEAVRRAAHEALCKLSGLQLPASRPIWETWAKRRQQASPTEEPED